MTEDIPSFSRQVQDMHEALDSLKRSALPAGMSEQDKGRFLAKAIPQSLLFMVEIIPVIHRLYSNLPEGTLKSVLDVGPENMAGTGLLQQIHSKYSYSRLKLQVEALDITDTFRDLGSILAPTVNLIVSDIFDVRKEWDLLIASHVIEHVPDAPSFVRRLQEVTKDFVILACPWREDPLTTSGHINTIDKQFIQAVGGRDLQIYTNVSWGKDREVCIFWVPGKAGGVEQTNA